MSEKSGIEMLKHIQESVDLLNRRYEVVEHALKEALNRLNNFSASVQPVEVSGKPKIVSTTPMPKAPMEHTTDGSAVGSTKVMGKIKHENRAVIGVSVTVKNIQEQIVKQTKTNRAGDWMCFLPPGNYQVEYSLKNVIDAKVKFQVVSGQTLLRVAQPQEK